jgi:hypothetical protein
MKAGQGLAPRVVPCGEGGHCDRGGTGQAPRDEDHAKDDPREEGGACKDDEAGDAGGCGHIDDRKDIDDEAPLLVGEKGVGEDKEGRGETPPTRALDQEYPKDGGDDGDVGDPRDKLRDVGMPRGCLWVGWHA